MLTLMLKIAGLAEGTFRSPVDMVNEDINGDASLRSQGTCRAIRLSSLQP